MKKVAVIMGSASDLPVVRKAAGTLKDFGVPCEAQEIILHNYLASAPSAMGKFPKSREALRFFCGLS